MFRSTLDDVVPGYNVILLVLSDGMTARAGVAGVAGEAETRGDLSVLFLDNAISTTMKSISRHIETIHMGRRPAYPLGIRMTRQATAETKGARSELCSCELGGSRALHVRTLNRHMRLWPASTSRLDMEWELV